MEIVIYLDILNIFYCYHTIHLYFTPLYIYPLFTCFICLFPMKCSQLQKKTTTTLQTQHYSQRLQHYRHFTTVSDYINTDTSDTTIHSVNTTLHTRQYSQHRQHYRHYTTVGDHITRDTTLQ